MKTWNYTLKKAALFSSVPLSIITQIDETGGSNEVEFQNGYCNQTIVFASTGNNSTKNTTVQNIKEDTPVWNEDLENKLDRLMEIHSKRKLKNSEIREYQYLEKLREESENPKCADEILYNLKLRKANQKLLEALDEYFSFHS